MIERMGERESNNALALPFVGVFLIATTLITLYALPARASLADTGAPSAYSAVVSIPILGLLTANPAGPDFYCSLLQALGTDISKDIYCSVLYKYTLPSISYDPLAALLAAFSGGSSPTTYTSMPNPAQTTILSGMDIYSPEPVMFNGALRMYFGGWQTSADLPHDSIFVADCADPQSACVNTRKVIDPVSTGLYQVNDPSIVLHPATAASAAYYIMYMTGDTDASPNSNNIYYATSWANDGIVWSKPQLLISGYWLPSATWNIDHVEIFANSTQDGVLRVFNLGSSGISSTSPTALVFDNLASVPPYYSNVDVLWRSNINMYQMLAERLLVASATSSSVIDYLSSEDGVHWHLQQPSVIAPVAGQFRVGTPAQHPDSAFLAYFGSTPEEDSTGFNIHFAGWSAAN